MRLLESTHLFPTIELALDPDRSNSVATIQASDDYDVAMIKVDLPGTLPKAELHDNLDSVKQGDTVFVIGYPFSSLSVSSAKREIPEPSISAGNIGKIIRTRDAALKRKPAYSKIGDAYQLSVNSTDEGYDGAPVFDDRARVVGIFNVTKNAADSTMIHSIDLHAVNGPGGGAVFTQVDPGRREILHL